MIIVTAFYDARINSLLSFCFNFDRNNASVLTASVITLLEVYYTVYQCVKRMVFAHAYILAWVVNSTALTNNNVACNTVLATENFYA